MEKISLNEYQKRLVSGAWLTEKPDFKDECLLITASLFIDEWVYQVWLIQKVGYNENCYMGLLTGDGDEYGDLDDLKADKYLILPLLK